jgi:hypothetical protein
MSEGGGFSFSKPLHQAASRMSQLRKLSRLVSQLRKIH